MAEETPVDKLCAELAKILTMTTLEQTICDQLKDAVLKDAEVPELSLGEQLGAVPWWQWILILALVTLSGCFSGLNLGVLGLDTKDLELMTEGPYET